MNIRGIELYEKDSGKTVNPDHIIGVDETGNHNESGAFAITAVLCPRSVEIELAEKMIECGMKLWKEKPSEELFSESDLPQFIENHPKISWFAIGSTASISTKQKAAGAITAAAYALIQPNVSWTYEVDQAALIHDGNDETYGSDQVLLREQAKSQFDTEFSANFGEIFLTQTSRGDQIYPTVMLADLISGQVQKKIKNEENIGENVTNYEWFRGTWVEGIKGGVKDLYYLNTVGRQYSDYMWENYAAWLLGKSAASVDSYQSSVSVEALINRSEGSEVVTEYIQGNRN